MKRKNQIDPIDTYVGKRLRLARIARGFSQTDIGKPEGLSFQQIQKYEKGVNRLSFSRLVHFARRLRYPVQWFYEGLPIEEIGETSPMGIINLREMERLVSLYCKIDNPKKRHAVFTFIKSMVENE